MAAIRTRKSSPPKVAPTSNGLPASQPASRPNIQPLADRRQARRWESSRRRSETARAPSAAKAAISATRPVRPRLTWAMAANTTATANTLTAGKVEAVKSRPRIAPPARIAQVPKRAIVARPRGHDGHGQGEPGQRVLQRMAQQAGRAGREPRGDHAGHENDNRRRRSDRADLLGAIILIVVECSCRHKQSSMKMP